MSEFATEATETWVSGLADADEAAAPPPRSPEARLWMSVLLDAWRNLRNAATWLLDRDALPAAAIPVPTPPLDEPSRGRTPEARRAAKRRQLSSCLWFFYSEESSFEIICTALDYDHELIRKRVGSMLGQLGVEGEGLMRPPPGAWRTSASPPADHGPTTSSPLMGGG